MCELRQKVALITGAASGIGEACALRFARAGATIAGFDLNEPSDAARKEISSAVPKSFFATGDVRDEARVESLVREVLERLGSIDVVVNAAGVAGGGPVHMLASDEWDPVLDVNLKGTYLVCKHALQPMLGRPEEIAAGALFLASDEASFVTGHALVIDGGFTAGHRLGVAELMEL